MCRDSFRTLLTVVFLVAAIIIADASGLEPANPDLNDAARKQMNYLATTYQDQNRILSGYNIYAHTPGVYEQTGMQAAVWGTDLRWMDPEEIARKAKRRGFILTIHWHWALGDDGDVRNDVDVGKAVSPGTSLHRKTMQDLAEAADKLEVFREAGVPVLWRPLHEIEGGWFWWTDVEQPENTARLWRMMYDYFTNERNLHNLIWVYSSALKAGDRGKDVRAIDYRKRFYPGDEYVDIAGIDIYPNDHFGWKSYRSSTYQEAWDIMEEIAPGKMHALSECAGIPDPDRMVEDGPRWLYCYPWWGPPHNNRPADWATYTMRHNNVVTLDDLPPLGPGPVAPRVGILEPLDDGSAWFSDETPTLNAYAADPDGRVEQVTFLANGQPITTVERPPYKFTWEEAPAGGYDVTARAEDDSGLESTSNTVRVTIGMEDAARGKSVVASSGKTPEKAVDGNYFTNWSAEKGDREWIYVDLGTVRNVERVHLLWGWKIHPSRFTVDVARKEPGRSGSWTTVYTGTDHPYRKWEATDRIQFDPVPARYVRVKCKKRAGNQTWGGYHLLALEVPVKTTGKNEKREK